MLNVACADTMSFMTFEEVAIQGWGTLICGHLGHLYLLCVSFCSGLIWVSINLQPKTWQQCKWNLPDPDLIRSHCTRGSGHYGDAIESNFHMRWLSLKMGFCHIGGMNRSHRLP